MADDAPLRADHRFMRDVLATSFASAGVSPTPEELDLVAKVFHKAGGTWVGVFQGSVKDVGLLKKTLKAAIDGKRLSKPPKWGG